MAPLAGEMEEEAALNLTTCTESLGLRRRGRRHAGSTRAESARNGLARIRSPRGNRGGSSHFSGQGTRRPCRICAKTFSAYNLLRCSRSWSGDVPHAHRSGRAPAISVTGFATRRLAAQCPRTCGKADGGERGRHSSREALAMRLPRSRMQEPKARFLAPSIRNGRHWKRHAGRAWALLDFRRGRSTIAPAARPAAISALDRGAIAGFGQSRNGIANRLICRAKRESSEESTK